MEEPTVYLTYSRKLDHFHPDLLESFHQGIKGLRIIAKGLSVSELADRLQQIHEYLRFNGIPMKVMLDLPGSKARIGRISQPIWCEEGTTFALQASACDSSSISRPVIPVERLPAEHLVEVKVGDRLSIADDAVEMRVKGVVPKRKLVMATVVKGGFISEGRSLRFPDHRFTYQPLTNEDLTTISSIEVMRYVDQIAVSFTSTSEHIKVAHDYSCKEVEVWPKIERRLPLRRLISIARRTNGMILGRGDLFSTEPPVRAYLFQKEFLHVCSTHGTPAMIATGLLEGVVSSNAPTIPDLNDIASVLELGATHFLLTGEGAMYKSGLTTQWIKWIWEASR